MILKPEKVNLPILNSQLPINKDIKLNSHRLDISNYLNRVEGEVLISNLRPLVTNAESLVKHLITDMGDAYIVNQGGNIQKIYDNYNIDLLLENEALVYFQAYLYDNSDNDELEKFYDLTDDIEESIERKSPTKKLLFLVEKEVQDLFKIGTTYFYYSDFGNSFSSTELIDDNFEHLLSTQYNSFECRAVNVTEDLFFKHSKNMVYVPFKFGRLFVDYDYSRRKRKNKKFYLRNVLVDEMESSTIAIPQIFSLNSFKINAFNRSLIPNISRKSFDYRTTEKINEAISYGILMDISKKKLFPHIHNEALENFCRSVYKNNFLIKY